MGGFGEVCGGGGGVWGFAVSYLDLTLLDSCVWVYGRNADEIQIVLRAKVLVALLSDATATEE